MKNKYFLSLLLAGVLLVLLMPLISGQLTFTPEEPAEIKFL